MTTENTFRLDGREIPFEHGDTVMDAALKAGEYIPHLCHNPEFKPHGSCRICIVDVNGRHQCSCTLPAENDMDVDNSSEAIVEKRRMLLQMLFVEGNHTCPACEKSGACQLQAVAYYTGMLSPHFTHFFPKRSIDATHPDIVFYHNRCILCGLCERASRDVDKKSVFSITGRGINSRLLLTHPMVNWAAVNCRIQIKPFPCVRWARFCQNTLATRLPSANVCMTPNPSALWVMLPNIIRPKSHI